MQEKILETKTEYVNIGTCDFSYLKELFDIMHKYDIHRIYRISNKNDEFSEAHQALELHTIDNSEFLTKIAQFLKDHVSYVYYNFFLRFRLYRFKKALKKFADKYDIELISTNSINICQGIYVSNNQIFINGVDMIFKNGRICHFEKLYLDI